MRWFCVAVFLLSFLGFLGISSLGHTGSGESAQETPSLVVAVSIMPQKFFVEQIGGKRVQVVTLVPQGVDPHTYEPRPKDISDLQKAKIYFSIGYLEVEKVWLERFKKRFPQMLVINTTEGIALRQGDVHNHSDRHSHHEAGIDPHVWLSPPLVMLQSRAIYRALVDADPDGKAFYSENFKAWIGKLVALDIELTSMFTPFRGKFFLVYHPAWSYFAEAYGLRQLVVEKEGKAPGPRDLRDLKTEAEKYNIKVLFVSSDVPSVSAENISKELGITTDTLNPLAYDWDKNIRTVATKLISSWTSEK
jgi:zinc transport system substrate-binding protein